MSKTIFEEIYIMLNEAKKLSTINPDKSYEISNEVYSMAKKNNLNAEEGYALVSKAFACRAKSEISKMLDYSYNAYEIFEYLQDMLGQIKSLNLIGIAYFYSSMYEESLKFLLKVKDMLDEFRDDFLLSCVLNNIGEVYRECAEYDKALEYYNSALDICVSNNYKINTASLFSNIGEIYFIENKFDKALKCYTKSYDILKVENDMVVLGEIENKLGKVHYMYNNYIKAKEYFFSALRRLDSINNKFYAIDVLENIAKMELEIDTEKYLFYYEKAIQYAEEINAKKKLSQMCKTVADYYEKIANFRVSLEYYKRYCRLNEEIMTSNLGNKLEVIKIELGYLKETDKLEKIRIINHRLEMEISNQKRELEYIKRSNEILEKKALEDELTNIPNRRYINYYLNNTWKESLLKNETIALFMIDIDNFKKYNDYWGHLKGDVCLIKVANCIKDIQIHKNIFGRYGGEEFIYSVKGITYDQALEVGNTIRKEVEKLSLDYMSNNKDMVITISVGGVIGKASFLNDISQMVKIADEELYKAKDMGRNITIVKNLLNETMMR
ncbi:diguanylate cyclase (GGDEF)-like protein [Sedimentibacter acidaminivorans]|uniref:Diguanylate cyclase (GGDEF)-like protein n=1 Tax=Sedimentibacter acidaminivorans TaxID=913099 RepID=A0ABS4GAU2_9FIRM|nr:tetratricopeptide repeat-containing diguanylate cyclase [Sedimentibacter acidaminivorans]MBP1924801.1 diguanylate cyclase (GGDEF)-like protein [Sedimentibacter acidaminivorans]